MQIERKIFRPNPLHGQPSRRMSGSRKIWVTRLEQVPKNQVLHSECVRQTPDTAEGLCLLSKVRFQSKTSHFYQSIRTKIIALLLAIFSQKVPISVG